MKHFVSHLECSATGKEYPANVSHNLSEAGKPLLVRYDLPAIGAALTKQQLAARSGGFWRYTEFLPLQTEPPALGEETTPLIMLPSQSPGLWVKDE
ncbi:MAG: threonine synthase, partial [Proteobacteria bacterium]|nr:threonine synthase [Pseudomonadota bacterium]